MADHVAGRARNHDKLDVIGEHLHSNGQVFPTLADGILVEGVAGAWTLGPFKEIIPANQIGLDFDIHYINIEGATTGDTYEIVLYAGEVEIGRERITMIDIANSQSLPSIPVSTEIQLKNTQIQAKVANSAGGEQDIIISLAFHTY